MAARLRARAGADDARATSLYLARFACTSPGERLRAFPSGEELIVCRFRLNQPVVKRLQGAICKMCHLCLGCSLYVSERAALQVWTAGNRPRERRFLGLDCARRVDRTTGRIARSFLLGPSSACGLPWGGLVAAYNVCPGSWELLLNGKGPPICRISCSIQHLLHSPDASPVLWCARLLASEHHARDDCLTLGSSLFLTKHLSRLLGLKLSDLPSQSADPEERGPCILLLGLPDGRVLTMLLRSDRSPESCRARLVCDLGQPVAAITCWQPEHLENKDMEMLIIGARGKVLSSCSGTFKQGPLPLGKAVSVQSLVSSVLTKLHPEASTSESELNQDVSGLLILDGSGGVRLVSPLPRQRLSLQGLHPHPIVQAKNELLFVQAAMQQLRQLQHHSITVNAQREDGHLVATFPDSEASNWVHVASFDIGDRTICRSASASPATGGKPLKIRIRCDTAAVATMSLVLPSREATGKPVLTLLKTTVLPVTNLYQGRACTENSCAHCGKPLSFQWFMWCQQVSHPLELELPAGCCWPALRAETLLRMLDMAKDYDDTKAMPDVKVGERVEAACREVERLLSTGDILGAYNAWRTRLGMAFPVA
ncbi:hypothetical protein MRX96_011468 [Rhipicephalus microplus]